MTNDKVAGKKLLPQTTYKDKPLLAAQDRFRLNGELNDYLFGNCDHEHEGYPNHLACRACVLECFACIEAALTTTRLEAEWQPIETAPEDRTILLGAHGLEGFLQMTGYWADTDWYFIGGGWMGVLPSHWMSLREPPAIESAANRAAEGAGDG